MSALTGLRVALYVQLLLGLLMLLDVIGGAGVRSAHVALGILIAVSAVFILRPLALVHNDLIRRVARFAPFASLVASPSMLARGIQGPLAWYVHLALAIAVVGIVEVAAARDRRSRKAGP